MVFLAATVKMTDEWFIASMSTLMKSEVTLRSESTVAARIIARVFPIIRDPSDMLWGTSQINDRGNTTHFSSECTSSWLRRLYWDEHVTPQPSMGHLNTSLELHDVFGPSSMLCQRGVWKGSRRTR